MRLPIPLYTFDRKKRRHVKAGTVRGNQFLKIVNRRHLMRIVGGFGIQKEVIDRILRMGFVDEIVMIEGRRAWTSKLEDWISEDVQIVDFGHGVQCFLSMLKMKPMYRGKQVRDIKRKAKGID